MKQKEQQSPAAEEQQAASSDKISQMKDAGVYALLQEQNTLAQGIATMQKEIEGLNQDPAKNTDRIIKLNKEINGEQDRLRELQDNFRTQLESFSTTELETELKKLETQKQEYYQKRAELDERLANEEEELFAHIRQINEEIKETKAKKKQTSLKQRRTALSQALRRFPKEKAQRLSAFDETFDHTFESAADIHSELLQREKNKRYTPEEQEAIKKMIDVVEKKPDTPQLFDVKVALNAPDSQEAQIVTKYLGLDSIDDLRTFLAKGLEDQNLIPINHLDEFFEGVDHKNFAPLIEAVLEQDIYVLKDVDPRLKKEILKDDTFKKKAVESIRRILERDLDIVEGDASESLAYANNIIKKADGTVIKDLFSDKPLLKRIAEIDPSALRFLHETQKDDAEFIDALMDIRADVVSYASDRLLGFGNPTDPEALQLVEKVLLQPGNGEAIMYFNPEIFLDKANKDFVDGLLETLPQEKKQRIQVILGVKEEPNLTANLPAQERGYSNTLSQETGTLEIISVKKDINESLSAAIAKNLSKLNANVISFFSPRLFQKNKAGFYEHPGLVEKILEDNPNKTEVNAIIETKSQITEDEELQTKLEKDFFAKGEEISEQAIKEYEAIEKEQSTPAFRKEQKKKSLKKKVGALLGSMAATLAIGAGSIASMFKGKEAKRPPAVTRETKAPEAPKPQGYEVVEPVKKVQESTEKEIPSTPAAEIPQKEAVTPTPEVEAPFDTSPEHAKKGDGAIHIVRRLLDRAGAKEAIIAGEKQANPSLKEATDQQIIAKFIRENAWQPFIEKFNHAKGEVSYKDTVIPETTATLKQQADGSWTVEWKNTSGKKANLDINPDHYTSASPEYIQEKGDTVEEAQEALVNYLTESLFTDTLLANIYPEMYAQITATGNKDGAIEVLKDFITKAQDTVRDYEMKETTKNAFSRLFSREPSEVTQAKYFLSRLKNQVIPNLTDYNPQLLLNQFDRSFETTPVSEQLEKNASFGKIAPRRRGRTLRRRKEAENRSTRSTGRGKLG